MPAAAETTEPAPAGRVSVPVPQRAAPPVPPTLAAAFPALRNLPPLPTQQKASAPPAQPAKNPHARKPPSRNGVPRMSKHGMGPSTHVPKSNAAQPQQHALSEPPPKREDTDGGHRIKITSINS
jgi:hypothetical protein